MTAAPVDMLPGIRKVTEACELILPADAPREVWLEARRSGIGSSDASAVAGVNKWASPLSVWLDKLGSNPISDRDNEAMEFGRALEPVVADTFARRTGKKLRKVGLVRSLKYPWMIASADRFVVGEPAGVECKTTSLYRQREWDNDDIPDHAMLQVLHTMIVTGFERYYVPVLIGGQHFEYRVVEVTPQLREHMERLTEIEAHFWHTHIIERNEPSAQGSDVEILDRRTDLVPDKAIVADDTVLSLFRRDVALCKAQGRIKKDRDDIKARLKQLMGEHTQVTAGDGKVMATHEQVTRSGYTVGQKEFRQLKLTGHGRSLLGDLDGEEN